MSEREWFIREMTLLAFFLGSAAFTLPMVCGDLISRPTLWSPTHSEVLGMWGTWAVAWAFACGAVSFLFWYLWPVVEPEAEADEAFSPWPLWLFSPGVSRADMGLPTRCLATVLVVILFCFFDETLVGFIAFILLWREDTGRTTSPAPVLAATR